MMLVGASSLVDAATQLGSSLLIGPFDQWNLVTTGSGPGACGGGRGHRRRPDDRRRLCRADGSLWGGLNAMVIRLRPGTRPPVHERQQGLVRPTDE